MRAYLCIDDTDNLETTGTGKLLQNLCGALKEAGLGEGSFITRHQLFVHDDIPYTSHNSAMCTEVLLEDVEAVVRFAGEYLAAHAAEGSDPGLCVLVPDGLTNAEVETLLAYGRRAKAEILTKEDARRVAALFPGRVWLSEHGGTGGGIIGALAGVALRLDGNDGRVKGKIYPETPGERLTVGEFCRKYGFGQAVREEDGRPVGEDEPLVFREKTKAVYRNHQVTAQLIWHGDHWEPKPKLDKEKKDRSIGRDG